MRRYATINLVLLVTAILLANMVSSGSYFRIDLTANRAYSLSAVSREVVARAEDPIHVKVFYSDQVPPPYNGVRRYLLDLLREYETLDRGRLTFEIIDTSAQDGRDSADEYGLQQVEIQEVRSDEFQSRAVFLGAAILYGSAVETVDRITAAEGLEYRLTTAIDRAISRVDALAGSPEPVVMQAMVTPGLQGLGIDGLADLPDQLRAIHERINRDNYDRIRFELQEPAGQDVETVATRYGLRPLLWRDGSGRDQQGLLAIVLSRGERHQIVPLEVHSGFFGGYAVDEPQVIEDAVRRGLRTLVAANPRVGYVTGAGERSLEDYQSGSGPFRDLLRERYELVPVAAGDAPIPPDLDTLIVNGPRDAYSDAALYRMDQFVMEGGSLLVFLDAFHEQFPSQQEMMMGVEPQWHRVSSRLDDVLAHYGFAVTDRTVLDEESFVTTSGGRRMRIYQAPVLRGPSLNRENVITRAMEDLIVLNATEIILAGPVEPLLETSPRSWTVEHPADAGPWLDGVPPGETADRRVVAALREGEFESFFAVPPEMPREDQAGPVVYGDRHHSSSVRPGRVLVMSTSEVTTAQLVDPRQQTPNNTFLMNAVDYLKGAPAYAELRSKGPGVSRLEISHPALPGIIRWTSTIVVPLLVAGVGLLVWFRRRAHCRRVRDYFLDGGES